MSTDRSVFLMALVAGVLIAAAPSHSQTTSTAPAVTDTAPAADATTLPEAPATTDYSTLFRPVFDTKALLWFGGLLWLLLAIDFRRFWSAQTLDILLIAAIPIIYQLRGDHRPVRLFDHAATHSLVAWTVLVGIAAYFALRTFAQLLRREPREMPKPALGIAAWVLLAFSICMTFCSLAELEPGPGAVAAMRGSAHLQHAKMMPYGHDGLNDMGGPFLYIIHALLPTAPMAAPPANWLAGLGHALILLGLIVVAWQYHSLTAGVMLAGLYALMPPVLEQTTSPDATVAAALVLWALIAAVPSTGVPGAVLTGLLLASAAWTMLYPFLLAPAWFAYYLRRNRGDGTERRIDALAYLVAFAIVSIGVGVYSLGKTAPMPPRVAPELTASQDAPFRRPYTLTLGDGRWTLTPGKMRSAIYDSGSSPLAASLVQWLASDGLAGTDGPALNPDRVSQATDSEWAAVHVTTRPADSLKQAHGVALRWIRPGDAEAARALTVVYRQAAAEYPWWRRQLAAMRTIVEYSWMTVAIDEPSPAMANMTTSKNGSIWWELEQLTARLMKGDESSESADRVLREKIGQIRCVRWDIVLGHIALAAISFFVLMFAKSRCTPWHLCSLTAALVALTQLWKPVGGGLDLAWFLPLVLASLLTGRCPKPPPPPQPQLPPHRLGDAYSGR